MLSQKRGFPGAMYLVSANIPLQQVFLGHLQVRRNGNAPLKKEKMRRYVNYEFLWARHVLID